MLIPAIDLKNGECVRLEQGRMDAATVFSDDPVAMARHWAKLGAQRLHIVDLDGAFAGAPRNAELVGRMVHAIAPVPVQIGGGVRDLATIAAYLNNGVSQVILGTRAIEDPDFLAVAANTYPDRIILGLDARDGMLATAGWDVTSTLSAVDFACAAAQLPLAAIVYTDISRDGMLTGVNVESTRRLADATVVPVIASGGVSDLADVQRLADAFKDAPDKLFGAITGRAIYAGTLDFVAGQAVLASVGSPDIR